jgi:hypothetical protein
MFADQTVELLPERTTMQSFLFGSPLLNLNISPAVSGPAIAFSVFGNANARSVAVTRTVQVIRLSD